LSAKKPSQAISAQAFDLLCRAVEGGWSINGIAKASGVSRVGLQRWYSGSRSAINTETLDGLCKWLGVGLTKATIPKPTETHHRKPTKRKSAE
jgi:transcriptional regulator with XRE-family HTH domain